MAASNKRTRKVVLAYPWTDRDGRAHAPNAELELDDVEARRLVNAGRARFAVLTEKAVSKGAGGAPENKGAGSGAGKDA